MQKQIFRQKSVDRLKKPDELNRCIRVIPPFVWLVIVAVVAIIVGFCIWGVFGALQREENGIGYAYDGKIYIYQPTTAEFPVESDSECYVEYKGDRIPIHIEEANVRMSAKDLITGDENGEMGEYGDVEEYLRLFTEMIGNVARISNARDTDFSELLISVGSVPEQIDEGFVTVKIVVKSTSLYEMMFS